MSSETDGFFFSLTGQQIQPGHFLVHKKSVQGEGFGSAGRRAAVRQGAKGGERPDGFWGPSSFEVEAVTLVV